MGGGLRPPPPWGGIWEGFWRVWGEGAQEGERFGRVWGESAREGFWRVLGGFLGYPWETRLVGVRPVTTQEGVFRYPQILIQIFVGPGMLTTGLRLRDNT